MTTPPAGTGAIPALVLAGGRTSGWFARRAGTSVKALAPLAGRTLADWTCHALLRAEQVGRVTVVGPPELAHALPDGCEWVAERSSAPDNVLAGLRYLGETGPVLLCAADLPALTAAAVDDFLRRAPHADAVLPLIPYPAVRERFPGEWGYALRFQEGQLTAGGMILVHGGKFQAQLPAVRSLFEKRKNPLAMAGWLGLAFLLKLLPGRLSVTEVESRLTQLSGLTCATVPHCAPELAFDVDSLVDLRYAERWLTEHGAAT